MSAQTTSTFIEHAAGSPQEAATGPLVSVIVIFLNGERFIDEAIESVFAQTYEEWELLLIDDGSYDRSTEIARGYASEYPNRVRYFEHAFHQNLGMSTSRNLGIDKARGKLIAFIDADDVWLPEKLEEQIAILAAHPEAAMVYGQTRYWYSWTKDQVDVERDFIPAPGVPVDRVLEPPSLVFNLLQNQIPTTTGALARREVVEQVGGYESTFRGMFEDQALHSKICLNAPVYVSSRCWYKYRRHSDSCCSRAESIGVQHRERLKFLDWLDKYSRDVRNGCNTDDELFRLLKRERWKALHPRLSRIRDDLCYRTARLKEALKSSVRQVLPFPVYLWLRSRRHGVDSRPPVGLTSFGDLRRLTPISRVFGFDRGTPIDRYYIEAFLAANARDIKGRVLEIGDDAYTRRFGGARVTHSDVLHVSEDNLHATIVADLENADHIESKSFDCIILTQTLHLIYDVRAAIATLHRILKPGGVLLATMPGISQIDHYDWGDRWYWSFTGLSAKRLFGEKFSDDNLKIETHGNVLASVSFLYGLVVEEMREEELEFADADYPLVITVKATREIEA
jgi:glycosyltransferase involved in cell wall biosynthesis